MPPPPPTAPTTTAHTSSAPVDFINHLPVAQPVTSKRHLAIGAAIAATLLVAGLVVWLALPTSTPTTGDASNPAPAPTDGTQDALRKLLPAGYPPGTCNAAGVNTELATAALTCGPNTDPGGPPRSSFTLARNPSALQALFAQDIATTSIVVCPGNIQSPGPWRKLATPDVVQGTVVCGLRDGHPLVAWTTTNKRLTATIESDNPSGATLEQLYAWWSSHS
jgi:serine/threonine-protein kinase